MQYTITILQYTIIVYEIQSLIRTLYRLCKLLRLFLRKANFCVTTKLFKEEGY